MGTGADKKKYLKSIKQVFHITKTNDANRVDATSLQKDCYTHFQENSLNFCYTLMIFVA